MMMMIMMMKFISLLAINPVLWAVRTIFERWKFSTHVSAVKLAELSNNSLE